jgi:glycosyltransferase involved in cell wall biosynthesis
MSDPATPTQSAAARRILLIIPYGGVGGMERLALNLYTHYRSLGDTVKVLKLVRLPGDIVNFGEDEIALSERDLVEMPVLGRLWFYLSIPFSIARIVRKHRISHSIAFGDMANLFSSLSWSREFKVASIHSLKSVELSIRTLLNRIFRLAYRSSYARFSRVVCISCAIQEDLLTRCGYAFARNLQVIYNPHDIGAIQTLAGEALDPEDELFFTTKTVVFLGRLAGAKAPWHLINAFRSVINRGIRARLLFIGDGDPEVTRYAELLVDTYDIGSHVVFLGRQSNPYKYLARADVLALSSHFEGTPNVIVEAIALGVPVVSSNCTDGILELMTTSAPTHSNALLEVDAGIVTPPLFEGQLGIPDKLQSTTAEDALSEALASVLESAKYRTRLLQQRDILLQKFDLARSAQAYLAPLLQQRAAAR